MQFAAKKTTALVATAAAVGFSSLFMAFPANAAPATCSNGATLLLAENVCELRITTTGTSTFTPSAEMGQLEVLLVGGGGAGNQGYSGSSTPSDNYDPSGGGGGAVTIVGFSSDPTADLRLTVGGPGLTSVAMQGAAMLTAAWAGGGGKGGVGGASGSGNLGAGAGGGGGGAGASPAGGNSYNGGAGAIVADIAPIGSLFSTDNSCYGGGGASGVGTATCGGGSAGAPGSANTGGGGGAGATLGGSGLVVLRWIPLADVTISFSNNGHGGTVAPQTFSPGGTATRPAVDPTETGFVFNGWYTDAALKTQVDFSLPVTASTTFYASWTAVTPTTVTATFSDGHGGNITQTLVPGGLVTPPADPTATGFVFNGWYGDAALTTQVDFSVPITASTTFYASWSAVTPSPTPSPTPSATPTPTPSATPTPSPTPTTAAAAAATVDPELARTGSSTGLAAVPVGLAGLGMGLGLFVFARRRARRSN